MKTAFTVVLLILIAAGILLPACAAAPVPFGAEIPVGCLMSPSAMAARGPNLIKAVETGVEAVNSKGGIAGKPLKLILADEGPSSASSLYAAHKLVEANKVQMIVGGTTSEAVMTLGPYVESKGVLLVSPTATSSELSKYGWSRWVFRVPPGDTLQGGVAAKVIRESGYKRVAMLFQGTVYGRGVAEVTAEYLRGIAEVVISQPYDPAKLSYLAELNSIKDKKPDCIFHAGYYADGAVIYSQALTLGMDAIPWIAVDGVYDMPLDKSPDAAKFMEKALTGTVPMPDLKSAVYTQFADRYRALYGFRPTIYCDTAYDAVNIMADVIREAGVYHGSKARDILASRGSYQGTSGTITFNSSGARLAGIYGIWKVKTDGAQYKYEITGQPVNFTRSGQ